MTPIAVGPVQFWKRPQAAAEEAGNVKAGRSAERTVSMTNEMVFRRLILRAFFFSRVSATRFYGLTGLSLFHLSW